MKNYKIISFILTIAMLCTAFGFTANANDDQSYIDAKWHGDYTNAQNPVLKIDFKSSAGYIQTIAVVMYDDDFDALSETNKPKITDYYKMKEVVIKKGENAQVVFDISDAGTPLSDGAYNVLIQGSGKDVAQSRVQIPVWVINPSKIPGVMTKFNNATESNVKAYLDEVKNPLQINVASSESSVRLNAFINIRDIDYKGEFKTLHDVQKAWNISEIIAYLASSSVDANKLQDIFENNGTTLGINTNSSDYKTNAKDVYDAVIYNNKLIPATCVSDIVKLFNGAVAIATINNASNTTISSKLVQYYSSVGISEETYKKFSDCKDSQAKSKIERLFVNKAFKTPDDIKKVFVDAVNTYIDETEVVKPSGNVGSNSGSAGGGSYTPVKGLDSTVDATLGTSVMKNSFADCTSDHWAYSYVEQLKTSGIVSGYLDGNFYPDNKVKREEFVKMIVVLANMYSDGSKCEFDDVSKDDWYYTYVASAFEQNIISGESEKTFGSGQYVSRQDVAVIICRLLDKAGVTVDLTLPGKTFGDKNKISEYAVQSVDTLTKLNIINGFEDGNFRPDASLTRAEAAKIISLVKNYIK